MNTSVIVMLLISAISTILGAVPYIVSTLKGETKPNRVSWFLWGVIPMIAFWGLFQEGLTWGAYSVFMAGFIPFVILGVSFLNPKSYWKLGKFDYYCGALTIVAIALGFITKNPLFVILLTIIADIFAGIPILKKAYQYPETESPWLFLMAAISISTSFFVMERYDISEVIFNLYLVLLNLILVLFLRKNIKKTFIEIHNRYIKK